MHTSEQEMMTCRLCGAEHPTGERPVADGFTRITNRRIMRMHTGLTALGQRRLDKKTEKKVVALMRRYIGPYFDDYHTMDSRALREIELPEGLAVSELPAAVIEARNQAHEDVLNDTQDIPTIPEHLYLDDDDMPLAVKKKDDLDAAMQTGVAEIKWLLGFLYVDDDEEE